MTEANVAAEPGNAPGFEVVNVCARCGHTLVGETPAQCPVCNAKKETHKTC